MTDQPVATLNSREAELAAFALRIANIEDSSYADAEGEFDLLADRLEQMAEARSSREQRRALAELLATLPTDEDRGRALDELKNGDGPLAAVARTLETAGEEIRR